MKRIVLCLFLFLIIHVSAETIYLKDGKIIQGTVVSVDSLFVKVKTSFGTAIIERAKIERIENWQEKEKSKIQSPPPSGPTTAVAEGTIRLSDKSIGVVAKSPIRLSDKGIDPKELVSSQPLRINKVKKTDSSATIRLRREGYFPFGISSAGFWSIGIGYRRGIVPDAYSEIEFDYGHWEYEGFLYEYLLFPVTAVYGKGIGLDSPWWQFRAGIGGRIAIGYESLTYGNESVGDLIFVPYIVGVLKIPIVWLEGNLCVISGEPQIGTRIYFSFDELFKALGGSKE